MMEKLEALSVRGVFTPSATAKLTLAANRIDMVITVSTCGRAGTGSAFFVVGCDDLLKLIGKEKP